MATTRVAMNRAVRTGVPVRVTSLTSTTPRRLVISTRRPALVAVTSYARVPSPESITISTRSPFTARAASVGRQRRVDLAHPGQHAPADVHGVGEARVLDHRQRLGAAGAALAVQHDPLVLRQLLQRVAVQELALGDERRAGDGDDLVLGRLARVDQEDVLARV